MKLYIGNKKYSSWSLRPWLVLKHFAIPFTEQVIPLDLPETRGQIEVVSPSGRVPTLVHEGRTIWESLAICEYVAELHPELALWPISRSERALARSISHEMHAGFRDLRENCPMKVTEIFKGFQARPGAIADIQRIDRLWRDALEKSGGPFLFGRFTIADAMYAPVAFRIRSYELPISSIGSRYVKNLLEHPGMRQWQTEAEKEKFDMKRYASPN